MAKPFPVEHAGGIATAVMAISAIVSVISLADLSTQSIGLGTWAYWTVVIGILIFLLGLFLFAVFLRTVRDFRALMVEESKAIFIKNLDDVEYLAWKLPNKYELELAAKKQEFNIKSK